MSKERLAEKLRNLLSDLYISNWIFSSNLEKGLLIGFILLGFWNLLRLIKLGILRL